MIWHLSRLTSVPLSLALLCRDFASTPSTPALSTFVKSLHIVLTGRFLLRTIIMLPHAYSPNHFISFTNVAWQPNSLSQVCNSRATWSTWIGLFTTPSNSKRIWKQHQSVIFSLLEKTFFQSHFLHANFLSLSVEQCGKYLKPKEKNALTSLQLSPFSSRNQHFPVRPETFQMIEIIKQTSKVIWWWRRWWWWRLWRW